MATVDRQAIEQPVARPLEPLQVQRGAEQQPPRVTSEVRAEPDPEILEVELDPLPATELLHPGEECALADRLPAGAGIRKIALDVVVELADAHDPGVSVEQHAEKRGAGVAGRHDVSVSDRSSAILQDGPPFIGARSLDPTRHYV